MKTLIATPDPDDYDEQFEQIAERFRRNQERIVNEFIESMREYDQRN